MNKKQLNHCASAFVICAASLVGGATAQAQSASTVYQGTVRDPFARRPTIVVGSGGGAVKRATTTTKSAVPKEAKKPELPKTVAPPDVQTRIERYRAQRAAAIAAQTPAPKPVTAFLLDEVQVTGIFRTPRGYAAMVEATPIKLSYVIYPGEMFYNGQLVAVEENRLVFRRETMYANGKREKSVEMKPLRAVDAVRDALTASREDAAPSAPQPAPASATSAAANPDAVPSGGTIIMANSKQPE